MKYLFSSVAVSCFGMLSLHAASLAYHLDFDSTVIPDSSTNGTQSGISNKAVITSDLAAPGSIGALLSPCASGTRMGDIQTALGDGSFVLSFWVNLEDTGGGSQTILCSPKFSSSLSRKLNFVGNELRYGVHGDGTMTHTSDITVTYGEWANIAMYYDSTAGDYGQLTFALNGQIVGSPIDIKGQSAIMTFDNNMHLGMTPFTGSGRQYMGANTLLDEFKVYSFDKSSGDNFAAMAYNEFTTGNALIPETTTAALGLFGLSLLLLGRRQRR